MRVLLPLRALISVLGSLVLVACADGDDKRPPEMAPLPSAGSGGGGGGGGASSASSRWLLRNVRLGARGTVDVRVDDGRIVAIGSSLTGGDDRVVEGKGRFIVPGYIDSHVHVTYYPVADRLPATGIIAAVDLASPLDSLDDQTPDLELLRSGPMLTALLGYPTQSWGRDGYGYEIADTAQAASAVNELDGLGARVIKLAITDAPSLSEAQIGAAVAASHELNLLVAAHALAQSDADKAVRLGVDVLAHTPTQPLSDELVRAWGKRAVISTLAAFGGSAAAVDNLRRIHESGGRVLYGTDLGNLTTVGLSGGELDLLEQAGLDAADIVAALTSSPAEFWGLDELGVIAVDKHASFVLLDADPLLDPRALLAPAQVYVKGRLLPAAP